MALGVLLKLCPAWPAGLLQCTLSTEVDDSSGLFTVGLIVALLMHATLAMQQTWFTWQVYISILIVDCYCRFCASERRRSFCFEFYNKS
jgi:hypothetical protein